MLCSSIVITSETASRKHASLYRMDFGWCDVPTIPYHVVQSTPVTDSSRHFFPERTVMMKGSYLTRAMLAAATFFVAHVCPAATLAIPPGFTHVRTEQDISEYRLEANGLTVL